MGFPCLVFNTGLHDVLRRKYRHFDKWFERFSGCGVSKCSELFTETKLCSIATPLSSLNRSLSPPAGTCWRITTLLQERPQRYPHPSTHTLLRLLTYTFYSVSHFYARFRDTHFLLSSPFLLLFLMAEWNPKKKNKTPPHAANILQNEATHDCSEVFILFTQPKTAQTNQGRTWLQQLNNPNIITQNLMDWKKSETSPRLGIFASSLHKSSFHPDTRYYHNHYHYLWRNAS